MIRQIALYRNRAIAIAADLISIVISAGIAYCFRFNFLDLPSSQNFAVVHLSQFIMFVCILVPVQFLWFFIFGLYRGVWRFASIPDLVRIFKSAALGAFSLVLLAFVLRDYVLLPRALPLLYFIFLVTFMSGARLGYRVFKTRRGMNNSKSVLIVGAGDAGEGLARDLLRHASQKYNPVGFLDDHPIKQGRELHGVRVLGKVEMLERIVEERHIEHVFIAIPSLSAKTMRRIVDLCQNAGVPYSTLPSLQELTSSQVHLGNIRKVALEDLIGREEVQVNIKNITEFLNGEVVLVTGGGGSIGSELCRQVARFAPKKLIVVDHSEFNLYEIDQELQALPNHIPYAVCLGSIADPYFMEQVFETYQPKVVFHAAAYKHVPMLEDQIDVAVKNNVLGTKQVADLAVKYQVKRFILISTDKAVNPTNIMGATKRAAEFYCSALNQAHVETKFMVVRFGNVINSAGSVVPLFRKQIEKGGPVTITHPEITRYFMTIPEACRLILQAGSFGLGGEIFVLDMGEPIKIQYLAERLIQFSGKEVGRDIEIIYTGLRPGEKLFEELFYHNESLVETGHAKIMKSVIEIDFMTYKDRVDGLVKQFDQLSKAEMLKLLKSIVPEYQGK